MKVVCLLLPLLLVTLAATKGFIPKSLKEWTPDSLVNPDELSNEFEGDILLPLPELTRNGLISTRYRWDKEVPYTFEGAFTNDQKAVVRRAMDKYSEVTNNCITFVERTTQDYYINFLYNGDRGCSSYVGKHMKKQPIKLSDWCMEIFGSVLHEIYHALGFTHEHNRHDRDEFVTIKFENIRSGAERNFQKASTNYFRGFGESYDYGSVVHYSAYAGTYNGQKTIVTKDPYAVIGQRDGLSQIDIKKLKKMYNC